MEYSGSCSYSLLTEQMLRAGITVSPADAHGLACALLVTSTPEGRLIWEKELLSDLDNDVSMDPMLYSLLQRQYADLEARIKAPDAIISLCLPDENAALAERVAGLSDWCRGFLFGMGFVDRRRFDGLREEAGEALRDLTEISRLDPNQAGSDATDEESFVELEEYVRIAVLLVKEDLHALAGGSE